MSEPLIIHHDNCPDGFGAAWWLGRHLGPHEKFGARYEQEPPYELITGGGRDVYVVDFCYPAEALDRLAREARVFLVFDHHQTAVQLTADSSLVVHGTMADWWEAGGDTDEIVLNQNRSGVGLVAEYVALRWGETAPRFLENIEDRDLWRFNLADTRDVFAAVTSEPYTDAAWDRLYATSHATLKAEGGAINRYRDRLIEGVAESTFKIALGDLWIDCASSPYAIGSDVAGMIAERSDTHGIGAYCILHDDHVQIGLRSRGGGKDVAAIAEEFGGGGHQHASGLRLSYEDFAERRWT